MVSLEGTRLLLALLLLHCALSNGKRGYMRESQIPPYSFDVMDTKNAEYYAEPCLVNRSAQSIDVGYSL